MPRWIAPAGTRAPSRGGRLRGRRRVPGRAAERSSRPAYGSRHRLGPAPGHPQMEREQEPERQLAERPPRRTRGRRDAAHADPGRAEQPAKRRRRARACHDDVTTSTSRAPLRTMSSSAFNRFPTVVRASGSTTTSRACPRQAARMSSASECVSETRAQPDRTTTSSVVVTSAARSSRAAQTGWSSPRPASERPSTTTTRVMTVGGAAS